MKKILLLVLTMLFLCACDAQQIDLDVPKKPRAVPDKAFWVGGLDGGVFVLIAKNKNLEPNEYFAKIYYASGDIAYEGGMRLSPRGSTAIDHINPAIFQGWDGDTLYIEGNKLLKVQN